MRPLAYESLLEYNKLTGWAHLTPSTYDSSDSYRFRHNSSQEYIVASTSQFKTLQILSRFILRLILTSKTAGYGRYEVLVTTMYTPQSSRLKASDLFNVNGLVAVVTGGGTGKSEEYH
jgi:hypothetical protein